MATAQANDKRVKAVARSLAHAIVAEPSEEQRELQGSYAIKDGLLYYKREFTANDGDKLQAWVIEMPEEMIQRVISLVHEGARVEHLGAISTYQMLRARYNWPGMWKAI